MKIFALIVLFFAVVVGVSIFYYKHIDASFRDASTGLFFFYPPALKVSGFRTGFNGEDSLAVLTPELKYNAPNIPPSNSPEHPLVSVSLYNKTDDIGLERWLTLSRSRIWAMAENTVKTTVNGHPVIWFSVKSSPYPSKIAYVDFDKVIVLIAAEYKTIASDNLIAWERIVNSIDITKH